jgi:hypothetical protein
VVVWYVEVTMQAQREAPPDMQCKDKFLVQSVIAPVGSSPKDVSQELFNKEAGKEVHEAKLRVLYVSPPQPPSPITESSEEGLSPKMEAAVDNGDRHFPSLDPTAKEISELKAKFTEVCVHQPHLFPFWDKLCFKMDCTSGPKCTMRIPYKSGQLLCTHLFEYTTIIRAVRASLI